jgi:1-phosphatidylinositol-3-phosphate 5-kinase
MVGQQKWLDIVSTLTWQAASYVRPDTKKGGSMDPIDYVTKIYMAILTTMWN